ncbi:DUF5977 domain-containing protein [Pedobacter sp. FW305-3-2-15-E-R2A2]|uniref:DUF5977 domain-containing protein n=1 Tax=Pedobacter sp. FW305-3-2-15-E-R2A2 TaxID=3140251 RepID=UPI00314093A8
MIRKMLSVYLLWILGAVSYAQDLKRVLPPSPSSNEFDKYVNHVVSLQSGTPEINIPIYDIQVGSVKIPIALSYHASGIKFAQANGDVGVGWALSPGYRITRTTYGFADEQTVMPSQHEINNKVYYEMDRLTRERYLSKFNKSSESHRFLDGPFDDLDGQYDIFTYGLDNTSGRFLIDDRANKTTTLLTGEFGSKINYTTKMLPANSLCINAMDFMDTRGVFYEFGKVENSNEDLCETTGVRGGLVTTAWPLTKISLPSNQQIYFKYRKFYEQRGAGVTSLSLTYGVPRQSRDDCYPDQMVYSSSVTGSPGYYDIYNTMEITTPNEKVTFERATQDQKINALNISTITGELKKRVLFYYSSGGNNRQFLDSLKIYDANLKNSFTYKFEYDSRTTIYRNYDFWGYYARDGRSDLGYDASYLPELKVNFSAINSGMTSPEDPCNFNRYSAYDFGANKSQASVAYSLKKITYPTGGFTDYVFEPNQFNANGKIQSGGIRIREIRSYDKSEKLLLSKSYLYGKNYSGYGKGQTLPGSEIGMNISERAELVAITGGTYMEAVRKLVYSSVPDPEIADSYVMQNYGWYDEVTEINKDAAVTGKTVYNFDQNYFNAGWYPREVQNPAPFVRTYDYRTAPRLKEKRFYETTATGEKLARKETYEYSATATSQFNGFKVSGFARASPAENRYPTVFSFAIGGHNSLFNYAEYDIIGGAKQLSLQTDSTFNTDSGVFVNTKAWTFNSLGQISTNTETTSDGEKIVSKMTYPMDYASTEAANNDIAKGIQILKDKNVINPVVEQYVQKSNANGTNLRTVSSIFTTYKKTIPYPNVVYKMESRQGITNFIPATVTVTASVIDSRYKPKISFNEYDGRGNVLEQQRINGIKEAYLWGYSSQFPVAKILNGDYNVARQYVSQAVLDNPENDLELRNELNKLRLNLTGSQVTTYTYEPLVGVTSITDEKGQTSYYEYDGFQRLKNIKDQHNNIIKNYTLNYGLSPYVAPTIYKSVAMSKVFTKVCTNGLTGTSVSYTVPAGKYTATASQAAANQLATNELNTKGQTNANEYGTCINTCTGEGQKIVNGYCETGTRYNLYSIRSGNGYKCTYEYQWSDGSKSGLLSDYNDYACAID